MVQKTSSILVKWCLLPLSHSKSSQIRIFSLILITVAILPINGFTSNTLPSDFLQVLESANTAVLYSLDPSTRSWTDKSSLYLLNIKVLGQMDVNAKQMPLVAETIKTAVANFKGVRPNGFDPHHDLRIVSGGHTYDFLISFQSSGLDIYKDKKAIVSLGITASPKILDDLLKSANIPLR